MINLPEAFQVDNGRGFAVVDECIYIMQFIDWVM